MVLSEKLAEIFETVKDIFIESVNKNAYTWVL